MAGRSRAAAENLQYSAFLFMMLVVDFMHEWELGVWKALLIHLLRIVTSQGGALIETLDSRSVHLSLGKIVKSDSTLTDIDRRLLLAGTPYDSSVTMSQGSNGSPLMTTKTSYWCASLALAPSSCC